MKFFVRVIIVLIIINLTPLFSQNKVEKDDPRIKVFKQYYYMSNIAKRKQKYDLAIQQAKLALIVVKLIYGENSHHTAKLYNHLGFLYNTKGDSKQAINLYKKSISIFIKNYNQNKSELAKAYKNIGVAYNYLGEYDSALGYYKKSLDIIFNKKR